jgi:hypothetical protein
VSGRHDIVSETVTCRLRGRILWVQWKMSRAILVPSDLRNWGKNRTGLSFGLGTQFWTKALIGLSILTCRCLSFVSKVSNWSEFPKEMFYCERRYLWRSGLQFVICCWCQHAFRGKTVCYVTASILRAEWRNVTEVIIAVSYIQTAREVLNTGNNL